MTIKWMPSLCPTYTQQHLIPSNPRLETNHPMKISLQSQTTSSSWQQSGATRHDPRPSKNNMPWEHMQAFYLSKKIRPMDIKTPGKEGDSPLIKNMRYLPPKMQWLQTYAWNMTRVKATSWIDSTIDYVMVSSPSFSQAMWANRKGSIQAMQSPKEAMQLLKNNPPLPPDKNV